MARICPDCSSQMIDEMVEGVVINACPCCAGVWVHPEALTELLDKDPTGLLELEDQYVPQMQQNALGKSIRNCPDDSMTLTEYHYCYNSPVVLQVCTDCGGFWIHDGQLSKMQEWINESRQPITEHEENQLVMAKFALDHENYMIRQENMRKVFDSMRRFRPGWFA